MLECISEAVGAVSAVSAANWLGGTRSGWSKDCGLFGLETQADSVKSVTKNTT